MPRSRTDEGATASTADRPTARGRIGYACVTVGVPGTALRTCTRRFATGDKLREIIAHNLDALYNQCAYNIAHNILLFRISSDILPFAGTPVNTLDWASIFEEKFRRIGELIRKSDMRVSMHPGQYTVLNSPDLSVVAKAIADLEWHARFMEALGVAEENKIILHVGGVYGDKDTAMKRFAGNFQRLSPETRSRIVIENDERSFSIGDVLLLHEEIGVPVVFDNLHREVYEDRVAKTNQQGFGGALEEWSQEGRINAPVDRHREMILRCRKTWSKKDGRQKIHYSQQDTGKRAGAHSATIRSVEFMRFYEAIRNDVPDIMLEVKDKNLSAVKCVLLMDEKPERKRLEEEWGRYKYLIMEHAPEIYAEIRNLFSEGRKARPADFYALAEDALSREEDPGRAENAALHVWGYFSDQATEREKKMFFARLNAYRDHRGSLDAVKGHL
ncbi:MAG: UV DNA damage repair endonuclease UvsE, partial [Clostridiales bacterium]|nr:UV DNA damage repair endonuclease UvsE [Clostridiales bacterium]